MSSGGVVVTRQRDATVTAERHDSPAVGLAIRLRGSDLIADEAFHLIVGQAEFVTRLASQLR